MEEQNTNPRSIRLKQFIEFTGMSLSEFSKQCELSSITTIHQVVKHHKQPTDKVLKKIIKRFPQLSYDWILLGSGEMLVTGSSNMQSQESANISHKATNSQINAKLELHDHALNELNNVIKDSMNNLDKKMDLNVDIIASINLKIDTAIINANIKIEELAEKVKQSNKMNEEKIEDYIKFHQESMEKGQTIIQTLVETSMQAMQLGERALSENKEALKEFGRGLEGYAKERDKKAEEITLVNVEKLFKQLIEMRVKGIGSFTKVKKS